MYKRKYGNLIFRQRDVGRKKKEKIRENLKSFKFRIQHYGIF
jgi:reverse gyrase